MGVKRAAKNKEPVITTNAPIEIKTLATSNSELISAAPHDSIKVKIARRI